MFVYGVAGLALDNSRSGVLELTEVAKRSQLAALAEPGRCVAVIIALHAFFKPQQR